MILLASAAEHPLARKAREGLGAARLLLQQSCPGPALDLLLAALLAAAAGRAGRDEPTTTQQAGIWLYGEALPEGRLRPEDAALFSCACRSRAAVRPARLPSILARQTGCLACGPAPCRQDARPGGVRTTALNQPSRTSP